MSRAEQIERALKLLLDEKVEYMTLNNLGDPETQYTVHVARTALALPAGGEVPLETTSEERADTGFRYRNEKPVLRLLRDIDTLLSASPSQERGVVASPRGRLPRMPAYFTHEHDEHAGHLYYFAPADRSPGPYTHQRTVEAIIDIADDGTLAGIELIDSLPPPRGEKEKS